MVVFTYSQARQKFTTVLDLARKEGEVLIKRKDGSIFSLKPGDMKKSPLDVKTVKSRLSTQEIVQIIRESRTRE